MRHLGKVIWVWLGCWGFELSAQNVMSFTSHPEQDANARHVKKALEELRIFETEVKDPSLQWVKWDVRDGSLLLSSIRVGQRYLCRISTTKWNGQSALKFSGLGEVDSQDWTCKSMIDAKLFMSRRFEILVDREDRYRWKRGSKFALARDSKLVLAGQIRVNSEPYLPLGICMAKIEALDEFHMGHLYPMADLEGDFWANYCELPFGSGFRAYDYYQLALFTGSEASFRRESWLDKEYVEDLKTHNARILVSGDPLRSTLFSGAALSDGNVIQYYASEEGRLVGVGLDQANPQFFSTAKPPLRFRNPPYHLSLAGDGALQLKNRLNEVLWSSAGDFSTKYPYVARVNERGELEVGSFELSGYQVHFRAVWQIGSEPYN